MLISYFFAHASITVHARWSMVYTDHDFELPYPFFSPRVTGAAHRIKDKQHFSAVSTRLAAPIKKSNQR